MPVLCITVGPIGATTALTTFRGIFALCSTRVLTAKHG